MFRDLREFIGKAQELGEVKLIEGADWNLEIGAVTHLMAEVPDSPLLLFDRIQGYPAGYRVASNIGTSQRRIAMAYGLPLEARGVELVRAFRDKLKEGIKPVPPVEVATGPVKENVILGADVDLFKFPVPKWRELDGGRYIGTGDAVVTRDPEEGWINLGAYRVQVHDKSTATILITHGHHGAMMQRKYWAQGKSCPAVVCCGQAPLLFGMSQLALPWGTSEYDQAGGWQNSPVEVTRGVTTDLPIPATAEIALEGEIVPPEVESLHEGPFGEWPGYYSGFYDTTPAMKKPAFKVKAILHRNNPIIQGHPPSRWPAAYSLGRHLIQSAVLWNDLDKQVPGVKGVWTMEEATMHSIVVISLKQMYGGHAKQAAFLAAGNQETAYALRYVIVVDDDIDPSNTAQVLWALGTRGNLEDAIDVIRGCWGSPGNPMRTPEQKEWSDDEHAIALILACKPYRWIKQFPPSIELSPELVKRVKGKWSEVFSSLGKTR